MTTTTLFSERGRFLPLYRFTLRQNAGYFGMASLLIFLFYPLQYLMEVFKKVPQDFFSGWDAAIPLDPYAPYNLYGLGRNFTDVSMVLFTALFLLLPFVLALMLNSYMHSKKAADVYHSLPIRREMLMAVNAAVAMTIVAVPFLASTVVIAVAAAMKFGAAAPLGFLLLDVVGWLACAFLIYAVTALICTQVGTVFDTFLFSGVFFFLLPILIWMMVMLGSLFLYGFDVSDGLWRLALWLSPVLYPIDRMMYNYDAYRFGTGADQAELEAFSAYFPCSNVVMVLYLVLGAVLLLLAMRLYIRRHSERAETTTSKGAVATTVQFAGTLLGGVFGGMLFYAIGDVQQKLVYLFWCVISGLVMFAVLEVILNRGFKTLVRRAPLGGIMTAATVGLSLVMMTGGLGYEKRVPDPETLESVSVGSWAGSYEEMGYGMYRDRSGGKVELSSPEAMKILSDFHSAVVNEQYERNEDELIAQGKHQANAYINLLYEKPGFPMVRRYNAMSMETLSMLIPLELSEEYQKQVNPFFLLDPSLIDSWTVSDPLGWEEQTVRLSPSDSQRLLEAIRADYLVKDPESVLHPQDKVAAHLTVTYSNRDESREMRRVPASIVMSSREDSNSEIYTPVSGPETVKILHELNLLPDTPDLSQCVGAFVRPTRSYYWRDGRPQWDIHGSMILRVNNVEYGGAERYYDRKESAKIEFENETHSKELREAGYREIFLEDPEKLALLAENMAPTWKADEPVVQVNFFSGEQNSGSRGILVPVSKLPVSLQEELDPGPSPAE